MVLMKSTWQNQILLDTWCRWYSFNRSCCWATEGLHEGPQEPRASTRALRNRGARLLIGTILTSCNYSPEIHSYCSSFNEPSLSPQLSSPELLNTTATALLNALICGGRTFLSGQRLKDGHKHELTDKKSVTVTEPRRTETKRRLRGTSQTSSGSLENTTSSSG